MNSEELVQELNKRNITLKTIEEYIKFEDDCVEKGFTFKSLLEAREKQIAKKVIVRDIGVDTYECPSCENIYLSCGGIYKYCPNCGQKLDLSEVG